MFVYSPNGLALTKSFEGCALTAYDDLRGIPTIGYGHTGPEVHLGLTWTQEQADAALLADTQLAQDCVNEKVMATINQNQFDALVDFTYNAGRGAFSGSTLLVRLNHGDFAGAAAQFLNWVWSGGVIIPGLLRRRKAKQDLFNSA